ncbi:MAG: hypothetical protein KR126chlam4_01383 [Candidatus Anoxychlamydiales bacterium]|uniref:Uncharacterized protein n=1 Tax=marine sediment metagenome TaxID=412755 RepID=A0A0F9J0Z5_9ZZZZ|nr:hypothetical protein [Candidatus Anoxychlamydiales bacterium]NGX41542.1 hypothetical protein [Candidatus Anoxychlamydiales bacterium]HEU64919.1 hypothetical protein [Chlamydiota bacterium]
MPKAIKKRKKAIRKPARKKAVKKSTKKVTRKTKVKRKKLSTRRKAIKKRTKKTAKRPRAKKRKKASKKPIWASHVEKMQTRIDNALKKLEKDIKRKASYKIIEEDNNELLMLLGECNYIVREFHERMIK